MVASPLFEKVLIEFGKLEHQARVASCLLEDDGYDQRARQLEQALFRARAALHDTINVIEGNGA
jgi:hypothetical protein